MAPRITNLEDRFRQLLPQRDQLLLALEAEALRDDLPIVGPVVGELLALHSPELDGLTIAMRV